MAAILSSCVSTTSNTAPSGFVHLAEAGPDVILEIRYYSTYNFVGDRIEGYEQPTALLTVEATKALKTVSDDVKKQGYRLKIFNAYHPQKAVTHFMNWAKDTDDIRMKAYFYPNSDKSVLFAQGYIAEKSGYSRGSTVDLTLFDMATEKEVDMAVLLTGLVRRAIPTGAAVQKRENTRASSRAICRRKVAKSTPYNSIIA